jgi:hypothetical protein
MKLEQFHSFELIACLGCKKRSPYRRKASPTSSWAPLWPSSVRPRVGCLLISGIAATIGGLGYGLYGMIFGTMEQQARGMGYRIGFQVATIAAIVSTVGYQQSLQVEAMWAQQEEIYQQRKAARAAAKAAQRAAEAAERAAAVVAIQTGGLPKPANTAAVTKASEE